MQAWGASSRFQRRETEAFPVKSALVGLLAAALRIDKHDADEAERLAPLAALRVSAYRLPKPRPRDLRGRTLDIQRLVDFHTVGGGYDKNASPMEKLSIPRKASGPPFGTVITRCAYLTDARFAAVFTGNAATVAPTPGEALVGLLARVAEWDGRDAPDPATLDSWEEPETTDPAEGDFFLHDAPLSFKERIFAARAVRHRRATTGSGQTPGSDPTPNDFFESLRSDCLFCREKGPE